MACFIAIFSVFSVEVFCNRAEVRFQSVFGIGLHRHSQLFAFMCNVYFVHYLYSKKRLKIVFKKYSLSFCKNTLKSKVYCTSQSVVGVVPLRHSRLLAFMCNVYFAHYLYSKKRLKTVFKKYSLSFCKNTLKSNVHCAS